MDSLLLRRRRIRPKHAQHDIDECYDLQPAHAADPGELGGPIALTLEQRMLESNDRGVGALAQSVSEIVPALDAGGRREPGNRRRLPDAQLRPALLAASRHDGGV